VGKVLGMAPPPFDPEAQGCARTEYRQGDVLDRKGVDAWWPRPTSSSTWRSSSSAGRRRRREVNLKARATCSRPPPPQAHEAALYASSVAAYGFHDDPDRPERFTEDVEPRGTDDFYYCAQKAELEGLSRTSSADPTDAYVFPPASSRPDSLLLIENIPLGHDRPGASARPADAPAACDACMPVLKAGTSPIRSLPFQLVPRGTVLWATAMRASRARLAAKPGINNPGRMMGNPHDVGPCGRARVGTRTCPCPRLARRRRRPTTDSPPPLLASRRGGVGSNRSASRHRFMDTTKARQGLAWRPKKDARETLREKTVQPRATRAWFPRIGP
jgi:hypothetical protein